MRDALIIGAGPGGSTAAILLARAGWRVRLVEQHRFPRDKVCGECLSSLGFEVLRRLGLKGPFLNLHPVKLRRTALHAMDGQSLWLHLPRAMWGISRARFDDFLLQAAREAGAVVSQPARCESLVPGEAPIARLRLLDCNETIEVKPEIVLLADGKGALLPNKPAATSDFGIKTHFDNVDGPRDAIEMFGVGENYGGLAPIEDGRTNAAFSVSADRITQARGDIQSLFDELMQRNPRLRKRLFGARRCGRWLSSPLPRTSVASNWPPGVIPIGNSAAAIEPIGGEGIGLAMRSAELTTEALRTNTTAQLPARFKSLWRTRSVSCRAIAKLLSSSTWSGPTMDLARACPFAVPMTMQLMGKS